MFSKFSILIRLFLAKFMDFNSPKIAFSIVIYFNSKLVFESAENEIICLKKLKLT